MIQKRENPRPLLGGECVGCTRMVFYRVNLGKF